MKTKQVRERRTGNTVCSADGKEALFSLALRSLLSPYLCFLSRSLEHEESKPESKTGVALLSLERNETQSKLMRLSTKYKYTRNATTH